MPHPTAYKTKLNRVGRLLFVWEGQANNRNGWGVDVFIQVFGALPPVGLHNHLDGGTSKNITDPGAILDWALAEKRITKATYQTLITLWVLEQAGG